MVHLKSLCWLLVSTLLFFSFIQCKSQNSDSEHALPANQETGFYENEYSVTLHESHQPISPHLMGFNLVYPHENDDLWQDGKMETYLKDLNTSVLRWPAGTVTSYYHWNELTGVGWKDSWDPENPVTPEPDTEFMDLDEFLDVIQNTGATPLIGINMSSGRRWNRMEEGIREALDLMEYTLAQGVDIEYWYLDNEPYMHDSNGGEKTVEEYAELINQFVPRMKEINPDIRIIVNWRPVFDLRRTEYETLLDRAGHHIDIIDVHNYWSWSNPNMEFWLAHTPTQMWTGKTYIDDIADFRQMAEDFGYPDLQLASLEWNVGPLREDQLTSHQVALIQTEMMMQFILGGLDMATFWPLHWPSQRIIPRGLINPETMEPQPNYRLFKFFGQIQGGTAIRTEETEPLPHVMNIAAEDAETVRFLLLNKNDTPARININPGVYGGLTLQEGHVYTLVNGGDHSQLEPATLLPDTDGGVSFIAPEVSVSMLTFTKE